VVKHSTEPNVALIEKRERHLLVLTLFLLLFFTVVTLVTFAVLVDSAPLEGRLHEALLPTALGGLLLLITFFCAYVFRSHINFARIRRLYQMQALRDPLTGLYNRQSFRDRFDREVSRADRDQRPLAVILCDLDRFKEINDTLGHQAGDELLRLVAKSTLAATRGSDLVFRWGGDEFLLLTSVAARQDALIIARRIRQGVRKLAAARHLPLDMSVGIAFYPEHAIAERRLIRLADKALYIAKRGGGRIHIGEEEYELNESSVEMVFQPVVEIESRDVMGYEALSRDPRRQLSISKLFQRYAAVGQLPELKRIIFQNQIRMAEAQGLSKVFINVDFETLESLEPVAKPDGIEVVLEISEAESLREVERHLETADVWRQLGYRFAIDDFGAGFMSLPFIARLVPEYIKVDRSTVVEAAESSQFSNFLRDLIQAMRNYSKDGIIAEGIETEKEYAVVRRMGVDQVQGFLTGRPGALE
jgi:diguanylate cyclase (GGDEF)-like protein